MEAAASPPAHFIVQLEDAGKPSADILGFTSKREYFSAGIDTPSL
jgi:hypothetical protein